LLPPGQHSTVAEEHRQTDIQINLRSRQHRRQKGHQHIAFFQVWAFREDRRNTAN